MIKKILDILLTVRIFIYMKYSDFIKRFFKSKPKAEVKDYVMTVFNNLTPRLGEALEMVLLDNTSLRVYFNSMSMIVQFRSKYDMDVIQKIIGQAFTANDTAYVIGLSEYSAFNIKGQPDGLMNLNDDNPYEFNIEKLKGFLGVFENLRNEILNRLPEGANASSIIIKEIVINDDSEELNQNISDSDKLNEILDKINKSGIESLNDNELLILKKIGDGEKK